MCQISDVLEDGRAQPALAWSWELKLVVPRVQLECGVYRQQQMGGGSVSLTCRAIVVAVNGNRQ